MSLNPENLRQIGINEDGKNSQLSENIHEKLAAKIIERIDKKVERSKLVVIVGRKDNDQPIDYKNESNILLASIHQRLIEAFSIYGNSHTPFLFYSQKQYDQFKEHGLLTLSEQQAHIAFSVLEAEDQAEEIFQNLTSTTVERIKTAEQEGNLSDYLMWQLVPREQYSYERIINETVYNAISGKQNVTLEDYIEEIEQERKQFAAEARLIRRMYEMFDKLPDNDKIKVAILRLPAEVDLRRPQRVLTYFPPHSYNRWSNDIDETNREAFTMYCVTYAPCLQHAFDSLYRLTRKKTPDGQSIPRAFYVTSQHAQGIEHESNYPESARRFLEISFADGTPPIPAIRAEMHDKYPGVTFIQKATILRDDIEPNLVFDGSRLHFILGHDEDGTRIYQNQIPYVLNALTGGVSNAYNIRVDQFLNREQNTSIK
ncbi:MAG: hypothetical protein KatS3mg089_0740 [Patescibacteria group bacterium]|nr:MAG: hypothetical protein KatS3mg089_0740 [Patescibacteria group bacterium]